MAVILLSLDTSTRAGSLAIWADGHVSATAGVDPRSHAERLPQEAMTFLGRHGRSLRDVDTFVVVAGPGSFTGLRVGVSCVQGWAFATGRPVIAVPSLDAIADGHVGVVVPMIDGQRGEVFFSVWRDGVEVSAPGAARPDLALAAAVAAAGPAAVSAIGDGADRYAAAVAAAGAARVAQRAPLAELAARLAAAGRYPAVPPHAIQPLYVRRPDAVIARDRAAESPS